MRVSKDIFEALNHVLDEKRYQDWDGMVRITYRTNRETKKVVWGVNWSCNGTNTPADARKFVRALEAATTIADNLNHYGLELVYEDSSYLTTDKLYTQACHDMKADLFNTLTSLHFEEEYIRIWGEKQEQ